MSSKEDLEKSYQWVSPIMHLGNELTYNVIQNLPENTNKSTAAIRALEEAFNESERVIYYGEMFSAQCNMSGLCNFFDGSISLYYYEVIKSLEVLGAPEMCQALKNTKEVIFGDQDVPVNDENLMDDYTDFERPDWDDLEEKLEKIEKEAYGAKCDFEDLLCQYTIRCGETGLIPKRNG